MINKIKLPQEVDIKIFINIFKRNNLNDDLPDKLIRNIASLVGLDYHLRLSKKITAEVHANKFYQKMKKILKDGFNPKDDFENAMCIFLSILADNEDDSTKKKQNIEVLIESIIELNFTHLDKDQKKDLKSFFKELSKKNKSLKLLNYVEDNKELLLNFAKSKNMTYKSLIVNIQDINKTKESLKNLTLEKNLSKLLASKSKSIINYGNKTGSYKNSISPGITSDVFKDNSKSFEKNLDTQRAKEKLNKGKDLGR